jgi:ABC-type polysaccharide/polyol phosphate transport system ATPase subunit
MPLMTRFRFGKHARMSVRNQTMLTVTFTTAPVHGVMCPPEQKTLLTIRNVSRRFGGVHALENINVDVQEGEVLGIIGPNGAGKSTLLSLIAGA